MTVQSAAGYEGTEPFPDVGGPPRTVAGAVRVAVTLAIVIVPFAGLGVAVWLSWGHGLSLADVLLAVAFYLVTGLGVTVGFHRLLTHRSFTAAPALRVVLAIAGSMSFEGEVIGWVAIHRRHHAFSDRPGDRGALAYPRPALTAAAAAPRGANQSRSCGPGDGVPGTAYRGTAPGGRRPAGCRRCPPAVTGSDDRHRWIAVS